MDFFKNMEPSIHWTSPKMKQRMIWKMEMLILILKIGALDDAGGQEVTDQRAEVVAEGASRKGGSVNMNADNLNLL